MTTNNKELVQYGSAIVMVISRIILAFLSFFSKRLRYRRRCILVYCTGSHIRWSLQDYIKRIRMPLECKTPRTTWSVLHLGEDSRK